MAEKYVIINTSEVSSVDFSQVIETSADTLRYSLDNSKTFVKFDGNTPSFLNGKTSYAHSEMITVLDGSDWYEEED
jgi:hypothetical protein|tara:strand:- start:186 stop:413 length:228 start_codon:yes stop_codon:yes gene_type:complete